MFVIVWGWGVARATTTWEVVWLTQLQTPLIMIFIILVALPFPSDFFCSNSFLLSSQPLPSR